MNWIMPGDLNNTNTATIGDLVLMNRIILGTLKPPQNLSMSMVTIDSVTLSFSSCPATLLLQRSLDGINWTNIDYIFPNSVNYTDIGLTTNTEYKYRMALASNYSNILSITTLDVQLNAPTNVSGSNITTVSARINWTDTNSSPNEGGYEVERALSSGGPFTLIGTTAPNVTFFNNSGLAPNTDYYYRVRAIP